LARALKINPGTVVKAYEQLRHAGLVVMKQGQGVFISDSRARVPVVERRKALRELVRRLLSEAVRLGADPDEVMNVLATEAKQLESSL
jgi:GntR family transcriptional regulator